MHKFVLTITIAGPIADKIWTHPNTGHEVHWAMGPTGSEVAICQLCPLAEIALGGASLWSGILLQEPELSGHSCSGHSGPSPQLLGPAVDHLVPRRWDAERIQVSGFSHISRAIHGRQVGASHPLRTPRLLPSSSQGLAAC